jgi:hypothetical protein
VVGVAIAIAAPQRTPVRIRLGMSAAGLAIVLAVFGAGVLARGGLPLAQHLAGRVASVSVGTGTTRARIRVWVGTLHLVGNRPLTGYGPDTFGMVYPPFRVAYAPQTLIDKAHSEILQVAATQGLLGLAAYLWLLAGMGATFWRGRFRPGAAAAIGGVVAYQLWVQANFSWLPATMSYWIFLGAAVAIWTGELPLMPLHPPGLAGRHLPGLSRLPPPAGVGAAAIAGLALVAWSAVAALQAASGDSAYESGLLAESRGDLAGARQDLGEARSRAPRESQYAFEAGRVAIASGDLGPARWPAAREALGDAASLGTFYSAVYYDLAVADLNLGRRSEAIDALRHALELSPGDAASLSLLAQINAT